ncbi:MAG: metal-dependent transcriptional regulator [Halobacteriales archaeon]
MAATIDADLRVSPGEGRYLCALLQETLRDEPPVTTGDLAEDLHVSGASVSEMVDAFDDRDLVAYEPYGGAELTDEGERLARKILWRRCTVQRVFDRWGISLTEDQAYRIASALDRDQLHELGDAVDQPCRDRCRATDAEECATV